jgi:DNA-binding CsgD family transcriptional regulator
MPKGTNLTPAQKASIKALAATMTYPAIAERFGINVRTVKRLVK